MAEAQHHRAAPAVAVSPFAGAYLWFTAMVAGWGAFFGLLVFSESTLGDLRADVAGLPLALEVLVWIAFFPYLLALTVWDASWAEWLRLVLVAAFAIFWSTAFFPRERDGAA